MRSITATATLVSLLFLGLGACGASSTEPTRPPKGEMAPTMTDHFSAIVMLQKRVVRGELAEAKRAAETFAKTLTDDAHPEGWHPYLQHVRGALYTLVAAESLEVAAAATAKAGKACGACHTALGIEVLKAGSRPPVERPADLSEYMWQHLWASESMWNGLIGPSEQAWREGANALSSAGLFPESDDVELTDDMRALATELNTLGQQATTVEGAEARGELYGKFLGTCAGCHSLFLKDVD